MLQETRTYHKVTWVESYNDTRCFSFCFMSCSHANMTSFFVMVLGSFYQKLILDIKGYFLLCLNASKVTKEASTLLDSLGDNK